MTAAQIYSQLEARALLQLLNAPQPWQRGPALVLLSALLDEPKLLTIV
ncbi:hypothetical protein [Hymenobacter sp. YC55]|nr:hypothetical protein [Hymenobacter sp. YC55]MDF7815344.1 hypothetical protein [Hymenobacter sp. YC55]